MIVAMRCQHRLFVEIAARHIDPLQPYPQGHFFCADAVLPNAFDMRLIRNNVGWGMTYLDIATVLTELSTGAVVFGAFLPAFNFQVRTLAHPNVLLSIGSWQSFRNENLAADNSSVLTS